MLSFVQKLYKHGWISISAAALLGCFSVLPSSSAPREVLEFGLHLPLLPDQRFAYLDSFTHLEAMQRGGNKLFAQRIETRLPKYLGLLQGAAIENELDWPLLAAMSYQESFWNPDATSPTGVRGLMMLTMETAKELEVDDRLNPRESIFGGARYFSQLRDRLPEEIEEPNRTWLALAAYNAGMGHLEDARILTQHLGKDPNLWVDVKEHLPLLQEKRYYKYLKNGYARGREAVAYVERIRQYRTILTWKDNIEQNDLAVVKDNDNFSGAVALIPKQSDIIPPTSL